MYTLWSDLWSVVSSHINEINEIIEINEINVINVVFVHWEGGGVCKSRGL